MTLKVLAATRKGLFTLAKTGTKSAPWQIERADFLADNVSMVLHDHRSGKLYAALDLGHFGVKMHRADGPGAAWTEMPTPAYPEKPEGNDEKDMWGNPIPWSTVRVWGLETGGPKETGVLWCGTLPGGLFRSDDHGASWTIVESLWRHPKRSEWMGGGADLPGLHSICIDPRNPKTVRCGVSSGGVWQTKDSGKTWTNDNSGMWQDHAPEEHKFNPNGQDAHCLVQCPSDPQRMWVQHHNGIFVSSDEGRTFIEITNVAPSVFGFPVVVHPKDPDTAWFVPAIKDEKRIPADGRMVVTRTRDGGKTFETFGAGLPDSHAYHLVYRHCLDVDGSGKRLAMGSTTGGLWVSESAGETWSCISRDLPPIHCVRFAA